MRPFNLLAALLGAAVSSAQTAADWANVRIGGGGGFISGIIFHPTSEGVAYIRTDIGGLYRLNAEDDSWIPLTDSLATDEGWHNWGIDAVALDPQDDNVVYAAVGLYSTNTTWDTNGSIIRSSDRGATWNFTDLPFKVGGNMPGRGVGERLAVDPKNSNILFFGARSGNGLWKSTDAGASFSQVSSFTAVGNFAQNASDPSGYLADLQGLTFITFDETSEAIDGATSRIFAGSASTGDVEAVWVSVDAGETWSPLDGQPNDDFFVHKCKVQPAEQAMYLTYSDGTGPFDGKNGSVWRYDLNSSTWTDITPVPAANLTHGFGGLGLDMQNPGTLVVAALNMWWPDVQFFRSTDSGATWSTIWEWAGNGSLTLNRHHTISAPKAPWIEAGFGIPARGNDGTLLGWIVESLEINPFNSDHMLYGTGLTVWGSKDLTNWDKSPREKINIESLAEGIEETAVLGLASAPGGTELLVAVGDVDGFSFRNYSDITTPPSTPWMKPQISTTNDVDYAGNSVDYVVRVGNGSDGSQTQIILSTDGGFTWRIHRGVTDNSTYGGLGAVSADADTILWSSWNKGVFVSHNESDFVAVASLAASAVVAADKRNGTVFYAAAPTAGAFLVSTDKGASFAAAGTLGNASAVIDIAVHPFIEGEVYVSTDVGVLKSANYGASFELLSSPAASLTNTQQIALGLASADGSAWNIYAFGTGPAGKRLYARSLSAEGASWTDIQGGLQGFGTIVSDKCKLAGSANVPGEVYVGTNGRGVFHGSVSL